MSSNPQDNSFASESFTVDSYSCFNSNYSTLSTQNRLTYSASCFDINQELFWCGTDNGIVRSYRCADLKLQCSVCCSNKPIHKLLSTPFGTIAISSNAIKLYTSGGLSRMEYGDESDEHLNFTLGEFNAIDSLNDPCFLVGGDMKQLNIYDIAYGTKMVLPLTHPSTCIKKGSYLTYIGSPYGDISIMDIRLNKKIYTIKAFKGFTLDMAISGDYLCASGLLTRPTTRAAYTYCYDNNVNVFDLRTYALVSSVPFMYQKPTYIVSLPNGHNRMAIADYLGNCQVVDLNSCGSTNSSPINTNSISNIDHFSMAYMDQEHILSFCGSPSGQMLGCTTTQGGLSLWSQEQDCQTSLYNAPLLTIPELCPDSSYHIRPEYHFNTNVYSKSILPCTINYPIVSSFDTINEEPILFPKPLHVLNPSLLNENVNKVKTPFLKSITLDTSIHPNSILYSDKPNPIYVDNDSRKETKSKYYFKKPVNNVIKPCIYGEIRFSKLGLSGYDFSKFNKTQFVGLETGIPESYFNSVLHLVWSTKYIHDLILQHTCNNDLCLSCELYYLFRMLDQAQEALPIHRCIQASNFYRMLALKPDVIALKLLDNNDCNPYIRATRFFFFLINCISSECNVVLNHSASSTLPINKFIEVPLREVTTCVNNHFTYKQSVSLSIDLLWSKTTSTMSFSELLKNDISKTITISRAYCDQCKGYSQLTQTKTIINFPELLCIQTNIEELKRKDYDMPWLHDESYFCKDINITCFCNPTDNSIIQTFVNEPLFNTTSSSSIQMDSHYELSSILVLIHEIYEDKSDFYHIVTYNYMYPSYGQVIETPTTIPSKRWYLFNDFTINEVSEKNALSFTSDWKLPLLFIYKKKIDNEFTVSINKPIEPISVFYGNTSYYNSTLSTANKEKTFKELSFSQLPKKGELVAIDCEFVSLSQEVAEITPDGHRLVTKDARMVLGRVSCMTENRDIFVDEYISIPEEIVDYLTKFSGLVQEDLDETHSKRYLVNRKNAYKQLRYLVDIGCIFIGHGLQSDFRTINIYVPKNQIIDTVEIYNLPNHRRLSLKFLASVVLDNDIQGSTHDSIEDADNALLLYKKYLDLEKEGKFTEYLINIYDQGRKTGYVGQMAKPSGLFSVGSSSSIASPMTPTYSSNDMNNNTYMMNSPVNTYNYFSSSPPPSY